MNWHGANETDVREEIAAPLLAALGYQRGTANDILREVTLTYGHSFLGRKKKGDPILEGRADYILSVVGAGRWVLEVKSPHVSLDDAAISQVLSYARHTEISATYACLVNGNRFLLFHALQAPSDPPLADIAIDSVEDLRASLDGTLSPAAIRRDCTPARVDLERPLFEGFRSTAKIAVGRITYNDFSWSSTTPLGKVACDQFDDLQRRMAGLTVAIVDGNVWRDDASRIRARLVWQPPHPAMTEFAKAKGLFDVEYVSLGTTISSLKESPTAFDVIGGVRIEAGEQLFDQSSWRSVTASIPVRLCYRGQALGAIHDNTKFMGRFQAEYEMQLPNDNSLNFRALGEFSIDLNR